MKSHKQEGVLNGSLQVLQVTKQLPHIRRRLASLHVYEAQRHQNLQLFILKYSSINQVFQCCQLSSLPFISICISITCISEQTDPTPVRLPGDGLRPSSPHLGSRLQAQSTDFLGLVDSDPTSGGWSGSLIRTLRFVNQSIVAR